MYMLHEVIYMYMTYMLHEVIYMEIHVHSTLA